MEAADVVVVGAGMAGNAAALSAAEAGACVCLLEKGSEFGGSSVQSGGALAFAGTDMQAALGIADSVEQLRQDLLATGGGKCDPDVVQAYLDHQLETFNWLRERGADFTMTPPTVQGKINRMHAAPHGQVVRALHARVLAHPNIHYRHNAAAQRLLRSGGHRVDGVRVQVDQGEITIGARRGVVLASGGFVRNRALLETFAPQWAGAIKMGGAHNTGDGLLMACALGAGLADMAYIEASLGASLARYPDLSDRPGTEVSLLFPMMRGAIIVNLQAQRFCNEALNYKVLGALGARQARGVAFQIFDQKVMARSAPNAGPSDYRGAREKGLLRQADTLGELAETLGLDAAALQASVERYNGHVAQGNDADFGRPIVDYGATGSAAIDTAPFYAFPCGVALTSTYCGIRVDRRLRVRDVFGEAIPGLYAAGEIVGGFHGASYMSGTALAKAAVHGRAAGLACANDRQSGVSE
jgi:fumarate reductase flavoprotein subunit